MKILAITAFIGAMWRCLSTDEAAMAKCEEKHSRDTCFYSLHR